MLAENSEAEKHKTEVDARPAQRKAKDPEDLYDISRELELLKEIRDIRDELNILRNLFGQQQGVLEKFQRVNQHRNRPAEMVSAVQSQQNRIESLDGEAKKPYRAVSSMFACDTSAGG